ncbi:hypothetical protein [Roseobacter sinensis]|uniref:Uncharacterized protein n=1 Tax=Roseobacter sinensis TaxID=2931391 RepID=A0ABT3BHP2_9RHOB|nr:hypothetical protein [Roseobacter sp. WL0113]MCV3272904.1 hypothetical protein [Roseobacter sp. WL0113]
MTDYAQFEKRRAALSDKHRKLARGYTAKIGDDGLITVEPRRFRLPFRPRIVVFAVASMFLFKSLMIVSTGLGTYEGRIDTLRAGTTVEQAAAWIMQPDLISGGLAELIARSLP